MTNWYDTIITSLKTAIETIFEQKTNKVTSLSSSSTDTEYPSAKCVFDAINNNINVADLYEITSDKGTASASTMNKLYIEVDNNKREVYYTEENNGSYSWHKLDTDILDNLSISWNDITSKPEIPPLQIITEGTAITEDGIYLEIPAPPVLRLTVDTREDEDYGRLTDGLFTSHDYDGTTQGLIGTNMVINWGDGTTESLASNTDFPDHEYDEGGIYNITVSGVTSIGSYCFNNCIHLMNVIIPSTVTTIGERAFAYCIYMNSIVMSEGVTTLGDSCLLGNYNLETISIPASVTSLGTDCFEEADSVTDYQLYWTGDNIPNNASSVLYGYWNSLIITIPNGETNNYRSKGFDSEYYQLQERSA